MTMSADRGGVFDVPPRLVRFGLGGNAAGGNQYVSWLHAAGFIRAIEFLPEREDLPGPVKPD